MKQVNLDLDELQVLLQCIYACKFDGKNVVIVGKLTEKLLKALDKKKKKSNNIGK